jgi:hypothetical protein
MAAQGHSWQPWKEIWVVAHLRPAAGSRQQTWWVEGALVCRVWALGGGKADRRQLLLPSHKVNTTKIYWLVHLFSSPCG